MSRTNSSLVTNPTRCPLAAGLALALAASGAALPTDGVATTRVVANCLNSGGGSLRDTIVAATTGDEVTFSASLPCSTITLSSGEIPIVQQDLSITGPGAAALAIDGGEIHRVFRHTGTGTLSISGLTITHGKYAASSGAATGGCLRSSGNIVLTNSTVSSCLAKGTGTARAYGGGIFTGGDLTLTNSRVAYNNAVAAHNQTVFTEALGGGVFVSGNLQTAYSTILNNGAYTPDGNGRGGGLYTYSNAQIQQTTIADNRANQTGGWGARSIAPASIAIANSTISGNSANEIGGMSTEVPLILSNSTIAFNQGRYGFGGLYAAVNVTLHSSIIADNSVPYPSPLKPGDDLAGPATTTVSGFNNLITSTALTVPVDTITACPKLGPLADNGGPTFTHALAHDSPAINHGNSELFPVNDQRGTGFPRMFGAGVDIGAYEWQGTPDDRMFNSGFESTCDR